jgi:hypothetical protein
LDVEAELVAPNATVDRRQNDFLFPVVMEGYDRGDTRALQVTKVIQQTLRMYRAFVVFIVALDD